MADIESDHSTRHFRPFKGDFRIARRTAAQVFQADGNAQVSRTVDQDGKVFDGSTYIDWILRIQTNVYSEHLFTEVVYRFEST